MMKKDKALGWIGLICCMAVAIALVFEDDSISKYFWMVFMVMTGAWFGSKLQSNHYQKYQDDE